MITQDEPGDPEPAATAAPHALASFSKPGAVAGETAEDSTGQPAVGSWARLPDESDKAYAAAVAFFELGPTRDASTLPRIGEWAVAAINRWREKHCWDDRARLYDEYRESVVRED